MYKAELREMLSDIASFPENFDEEADFYSDLGMPSMKAMELLMTLEDRYGVSIPDEEFLETTSLVRLSEMMLRLNGSRGNNT